MTLCFVQLWVMGDKYGVPSLVELVDCLREEYITLLNVILLYLGVDREEIGSIRDSCLAIIGRTTHTLLEEIAQLSHKDQARLFKQLIERGASF